MNRSVIITIIITAIISGLITYTFTKKSIQSDKLAVFKPLKKNNNIITPIPTEKPIPKYSVTILNTPATNGIFSLKADVKNISVNPFITGVYFRECKFYDNKNNEYKGNIDSPIGGYGIEFQFQKALLPDESQTIDFNNLNIEILGGGGIDRSGSIKDRCDYDNQGNKVCHPINGLKIKECITYTSTGIKHEDKLPLIVSFPQ
ncbi:MAG: hypothetical protein UR23_C0009G0007 [Candidatus Roizmanbacteria bacterium GW2011_GWA2_32_13]|uniref:Uncharacterized protein n=1 Tax=Candidatus Roizmanbacteria bacterium GW2011_GWA2_32_13 TaxID=1618475 RepID=A0A0G0C158_9BACT|nr:MAG: hypothetical protein UR23_C0009G0007 [Candidatus Roizmanbacteria bacterium GW2011_GWA2_32_13]